MKKHLFWFGSFITTSLIVSNTLLVISCGKNTSVVTLDEKDSDQVELNKIIKLKNEIKDIIDNIITNPIG